MSLDGTAHDKPAADTATVCPLLSPLVTRIPGWLSIAAVPGAIILDPFFFGLAGGLLAGISLLLAPPHGRRLGVAGLVGAVAGSALGVFVLR